MMFFARTKSEQLKTTHSLLILGMLLLTINSNAQDVTNNKFGTGLINTIAKDSSFSLKFTARFQTLSTSSWDFENNNSLTNPESSIQIRRARLKFDGFAYSPKLVYKIELGLSNRDIAGASIYNDNTPNYILDAVLKWNFYEKLELWVGQTKLPGNRERQISSANMETVDRSLLNSRFNIDRDMGLQLRHSVALGRSIILKEAIAISQGEGRNITTGNLGGHQYTFRGEILPFGDFADYTGADLARESTPKLSIGASYNFNDNAVKTRSNMGSHMVTDTGFHETDVQTFFADAMFKFKGWSVMGEYANRSADNPIAINSDGTTTGDVVNIGEAYNIQGAYLFKNNLQILGRFTTINPDAIVSTIGTENQYTIGLSKYIAGHKLKVQTDVTLADFENNSNNKLIYRLQVDIHF